VRESERESVCVCAQVERLYDFFLASHPLMSLYLAAAVLMWQRDRCVCVCVCVSACACACACAYVFS
jgi:hypothetical protein